MLLLLSLKTLNMSKIFDNLFSKEIRMRMIETSTRIASVSLIAETITNAKLFGFI